MKTCLFLEGGVMGDMFSAGVMGVMMEHGISFGGDMDEGDLLR